MECRYPLHPADGANFRLFQDLHDDAWQACLGALRIVRQLDETGTQEFGSSVFRARIIRGLSEMWTRCLSNDLLPKIEGAILVVSICNEFAVLNRRSGLQAYSLEFLSEWERRYPAACDGIAKQLIERARSTTPGKRGAYAFQAEIENALTYMFEPSLRDPRYEHPLANGLKRVDIVYTNEASSGFFAWVQKVVHCPFVYVEIKNYSATRDPKNPEFDQLAGRLNPARGLLGILVCRDIEDRSAALQRAREFQRKGEYVIALDLVDLESLAQACRVGHERDRYPLLIQAFRQLVE